MSAKWAPWPSGPIGVYGKRASTPVAALRKVVGRWIGRYDGLWANTRLRVQDDAEQGESSAPARRKRKA